MTSHARLIHFFKRVTPFHYCRLRLKLQFYWASSKVRIKCQCFIVDPYNNYEIRLVSNPSFLLIMAAPLAQSHKKLYYSPQDSNVLSRAQDEERPWGWGCFYPSTSQSQSQCWLYRRASTQLFPNQRRTKQLTKLVFRRPSPKSLQQLSNNNWILSWF